MTAKKSTTAVPTTTSPAKPKRARKPALKAVAPGTEENALAKLQARAPVPAIPATDFAFDEEIVRPIPPGDPMDLSADTVHVPPGFSFMEAQQEQLLARGKLQVIELEAEITDLTGRLRDADAARERDVASLRADLDEADRVKAHCEEVTRAALAKAVADSKRIADLEIAVEGKQQACNDLGEALAARATEVRNLKGKIANDRWHDGRLQAEVIRRKRFTFWERVRQVFRPDDFNGSNVDQALSRIRLDMVDEAEADALRGIPSSEGDLGALAHKRIKARGAV